MGNKQEIEKKAEHFVKQLLNDKLDKKRVYHSINHTIRTVNAVEEIAKGNEVSSDDLLMLKIAAWFHDTGYVHGNDKHEEESVKILKQFLTENNYPFEKIESVASIIKATEMPQQPNSLLQDIICDADMSHFGSKDFFEQSNILRSEWELLENKKYSNSEWYQLNIEFLNKHEYKNHYSKILYSDKKRNNLQKLLKMEDKSIQAEMEESSKEEGAIKDLKLGRGIETMFRITLKNHMTLSAIADNKANIMLSINAIIISISFSTLVPRFDDNPSLMWPTVALLVVCLVAIIFATLATRPKITSGTFTKDDIKNKTANLLFFGNFHNVDVSDFEYGMTALIKDADYLYSSMTRDLYYLGKVLAKKYNYLRTCYSVFMYGMILVVILFAIAFIH